MPEKDEQEPAVSAADHPSRFWGKAGGVEEPAAWHPLAHHSLDVAAVGSVLLERNRIWRQGFAELCGLDEARLLAALPFLLALHDIGKFADGFQALRADLMVTLQGEAREPGYPERHDTLGFWLWKKRLSSAFLERHPGVFPLDDEPDRCELLSSWFAAVAGHHGRPPKVLMPQSSSDLLRQFPPRVEGAARGFLTELESLFLPDGFSIPAADFEKVLCRLRRSSYWLAGWATTADWIGSNRDWFPFVTDDQPLADYLREHARPRADAAVTASGLGEREARPASGFRGLWQRPEWSPSPLQVLAETMPLSDGPELAIFEDVTGAGKTEAALLLAHRLIAARKATGLYFALPTMATANAMHRRVSDIHHRFFAEGQSVSLVLAHSRRDFYLPLEECPSAPGPGARDQESSGSFDCVAWLADSRKKALLAQVGVGTIDQALISVLPIRHQSLRLAGLAGKVLLVDEVHACDSYVRTVLERVLEFHAALGGSAILLSATLPRRQRESLLTAFARGRGWSTPRAASGEYPLVTRLASSGSSESKVGTRAAVQRNIEVRPLRTEEEAERWLLAACEGGGCACWVRNTVRDAVAAYDRLVARWGEERVMLFHSRFAVADRRAIESRVLSAFGPESGEAERRGMLLIATQVVEQSLDLDFDVMVTDLAPIDLVIQRSGRLRRHPRRAGGDRSEREERGTAVLGLLAPESTLEPAAEWYAKLFPFGAFVYPDHGRLWLTARWLEENGRIRVPEDARNAIELVYGEASEERIPPGLEAATLKAEGSAQADRSMGLVNALPLEAGYRATPLDWIEDSSTPTRLGEATTTVRLAKRTASGIEPWATDGPNRWEASEVAVLRRRVEAEAGDPAEIGRLRRQMRDEGRFCVLVVLELSSDVWQGRAFDGHGRTVAVIYTGQRGLSIERGQG